jgi:murein DD-endopeptidase MepM/ murein hydrolase activator NlpD
MNTKSLLLFALLACHENTVSARTLYRLPLVSHPGRYSGWFDHDSLASKTKRYDCKTGISYDGHKGTDFPVSVGIDVLAAASGSMYKTVSNCPNGPKSGTNTNDPTCGTRFGNHARIKHADGNVTIYAHLSSIWSPAMPSPYCGYGIGKSGNSGESFGPHFHFELRTSDTGTRLDPFGGSCSGTTYWVNQNNGYPTTTCQ